MMSSSRQRGSTLLIALIILILLTLIALSAIVASTTSVQVAGNAQFKEEATVAAQSAIETVISENFTANPSASAKTVTVGPTTYNVAVEKPTCNNSVELPNEKLNLLPENDPVRKACVGSDSASNTGILIVGGGVGGPLTQSWCYEQQWDVRATVSDTVATQVSAAVHQGVAMKVPAGTECK